MDKIKSVTVILVTLIVCVTAVSIMYIQSNSHNSNNNIVNNDPDAKDGVFVEFSKCPQCGNNLFCPDCGNWLELSRSDWHVACHRCEKLFTCSFCGWG
ncbi:MAG: hypothetical protein FWD52_07030 [Candidatus Bathyarchaeota archaeon]|nr:hypothetical protein [Candidatus Termiticorpusculum sp.]